MVEDLNKVREYKLPTGISGNVWIFGRIGSGKTCKLLTIAQSVFEHGYKIIDIDGGKRHEGAYWSLPNDDYALWEQLQSETYEFEKEGPKKYKVNLLYPMFSEKLPVQLPEDNPRVKCKVFTIPFKDIDERHVNLVLGSMSNKSKMLWQKIQDNTTDKSNSFEIRELIELKFPKLKDQAIYQLFFKEALKNDFFSSSSGNLNINWIEEMKEKDVITVLCLDYVPERYHRFIRGWILTTLLDLAMKDKIGKKNLAFMREVSSFLKVVDANPVVEEVNKVYRNIFMDVARYARSGLFLAADTQDSSEVAGACEGCIRRDTKILSYEGNKTVSRKVEELPENFKVASYDKETNKVIITDAKKTYTGLKKIKKIIFDNGEYVYATDEHRFFDKDMNEIRVENLKVGDELQFIKNTLGPIKGTYKASAETRKKISDNTKIGMRKNPEIIEKIRKANRENSPMRQPEVAKQHGVAMKRWFKENRDHKTEKYVEWVSKVSKGVKKSFVDNPNLKKIVGDRGRIILNTPAIRKKCMETNLNHNKPNKPEQKVLDIINKYNLNFKFTGNGTFWITNEGKNHNPDFVDSKNKKIIEVFGIYWHNAIYKGSKEKNRDHFKLEAYKKKGYKYLVIWDAEMNRNINKVERKILEFAKC